MSIRKIFATNLRRARIEAGFSQEELAFRAELDRTYISALEREVYSVSIDVLARLAEALKVEASELLAKQRRPRVR